MTQRRLERITRHTAAVLLAAVFLGASSVRSESGPGVDAQAAALVEQLGDSSFVVRENASEALIALGPEAVAALEQGRQHSDPEIRFRSKRILEVIELNDRERRLKLFAEDLDGSGGYDLPGWVRFRDLVGNDRESRRLFVDLQRFEGDLIDLAERQPAKAAEQLSMRLQQIQMSMRFGQQQLALGTVAGLIFVACHEQVKVPDNVASMLYSYCSQASFRTAIQSGKQKDYLRRLLGAWISTVEGQTSAYQALVLAMQYDLAEGVKPAERLLTGGGAQMHFKQYAIMGLAKLGNLADHAELLQKLLDDKAVCASRQVQVDNKRVMHQTQIRDLALVALIHLHGKDPKPFGFPDLAMNPQMLYNPATAGFPDDEKRAEAHALWREFQEAQARGKAAAPVGEAGAEPAPPETASPAEGPVAEGPNAKEEVDEANAAKLQPAPENRPDAVVPR